MQRCFALRGLRQKIPVEIMEAPLSEPFFTRRIKIFSRSDGFVLYGKWGIHFLYTSDMLYPNMTFRLHLIRARRIFHMIIDNPNVSLGIVDCSIYTGRIALKDDYHQKRMDMLIYIPVEFNYLEILAKTFIIPARRNQLTRENSFNNSHFRLFVILLEFSQAALQTDDAKTTAVCTRYMQLFISYSSDRKKLPEFTTLKLFPL